MKPGTFTQMYVQIVFAVRNREMLLNHSIRTRVFEYIGGINNSMKNKTIIVNGISDHVHILVGLNPSVSVSDTVYNIKRGSSLFINSEKICPCHFSWQEGFGAFTYSHSHLDNVYKYIENQEAHHAKESFRKEYVSLLERYSLEYDSRFLFDFFDDIS